MKKNFCFAIMCAILCNVFMLPVQAQHQKPALPLMVVPDGLGYNIHFTDAKAGEMEMLADSGATIIRMDLSWGGTERQKGMYDFSAFERLTDSLEKFKIRPLYILDYSNKFYDDGLSPHSEEGRTAFARWSAAAVLHFKDRGIIWEMYNEPNIGFWKPKPEPEKYILLALEVGRAIRAAAPNEIYIGPATSGIDLPFLEQCFKAGLLEYWDAVSVHPYRQTNPETVLAEYAKLRYLIDQYAPHGKKIPILSAEWGYSSAWQNYNDEIQGKMLPRQWLVNLAANVPISIWYDWHDDGKDPKEPEHHFGTTNHDYKKDAKPVYEPKQSYIAAKTFNETFNGFKYNKRLWIGDDHVYVFLFNKDNEIKLAAWTTIKEKEPINVSIPCSPGKFSAISYLGEKLPDLTATEKGLTINVSDAPIYLTPLETNQALVEASRWTSLPLAVYRDEEDPTTRLSRNANFQLLEKIQNVNFEQITNINMANPISIGLPIPIKNQLVTVFNNPSGQPFSSVQLTIERTDGISVLETVRTLELKRGETEKILTFPLKSMPKQEYKFFLDVNSKFKRFLSQTMKLIDDFSSKNNETLSTDWGVYPDGDSKVGSEQKIEAVDGMVKITYKFDEGWKFVRFAPKGERAKIEGQPKALGFLVYSDGSGNSVNIRYVDSTGQTFQVHGGRLKNNVTVHYFEFALDGSNASHWGGANNGKITYPIRFDSIIIDGTRKACGPYSVMISSPVLSY
ncbi:MAG: glycoside hydrolase family 5 protein [Planctomycetaceae bacterium]|nr:glycoside hydrolase family 5 protein [Planctomycetaceae bacterium]